jgi:hypothetical protein
MIRRPRPRVLVGMRRGLLLLLLLVATAASAEAAERRFDFEVLRNGRPIGSHVVAIERGERETVIRIAVDMAVGIGPIALYRYRHRSTEVWRDGRLTRLDADTDDDGKLIALRVWADAGRLLIDGAEGRQEAPADTLPSSYWHPGLRTATRWIDTHTATVVPIEVTPEPSIRLISAGQEVEAIPHRTSSPGIEVIPFYTPEGEWVGLTFTYRGSRFDYVRRGVR